MTTTAAASIEIVRDYDVEVRTYATEAEARADFAALTADYEALTVTEVRAYVGAPAEGERFTYLRDEQGRALVLS